VIAATRQSGAGRSTPHMSPPLRLTEIFRATRIDDQRVRAMVDAERFEHYQAIKRRIGMA